MTLGSVEDTRGFVERFDPQARAIADPDLALHAAFGLRRGGAAAFLSPAVFAGGLRALAKGNGVGVPSGDVLQLSGEFLVLDGAIVWKFVAEHAADHPELDTIAAAAAAAHAR